MSWSEDQHPVGELGSHCRDESFGVCVGLRTPGRDLDDLDSGVDEHGVEGGGELPRPVTDQEPKLGCAALQHASAASRIGAASALGDTSIAADVNVTVERTEIRGALINEDRHAA